MQNNTRSFFKNELVAIAYIAIPIAFAQLFQMAMGVTDTILLGHVNKETLAIGGLTTNIFFSICIVFQSALSAAAILIAQNIGAKKIKDISKIYYTTYIFGLLLCIPCFFILYHSSTLLQWNGEHDQEILVKSRNFMLILLWGLPPLIAGAGLIRVILPALNASKILLQITPITAVINGVFNAAFIYGLWGAPKMGLYGSALGTTLALWMSSFILIGVAHCKKDLKQYLYPFAIDLSLLRPLFKLGFPICISSAAEILLFLFANFNATKLGTESLAAHQIALSFATFTFMIPLAISQAANVRVSYWIGAEKPYRAKRSGFLSIGLSALIMSFVCAIIFFFPYLVVRLSLDASSPDNANTVAIAIAIIQVVGLFQVVDGIQTVAMGALRGLKDTTIPMILALISFWGVGYTLSVWFAFHKHFGAPGIWAGMGVGLAVIAFLATARFYLLTRNPKKMLRRALR
ncbi:DinF/NorM/MATE family (NorM) (PDB:3VVN) (PUBMED:29915058) [Commensalibacter communis]|uniref:MATE family efflux transporter n=1 Tax=Commensalibacter communis TaxID=2972786 RepID=UPI0022FF77C3|nr:MATE family efflux transporter [Commensalibacter communis]CAI3936092.1 DinF/NorM/MATE family (NorM) (PDB:3VVN) (PUBMED:29915058) [Commensalibacter communis]